jgi:hypothetical protein
MSSFLDTMSFWQDAKRWLFTTNFILDMITDKLNSSVGQNVTLFSLMRNASHVEQLLATVSGLDPASIDTLLHQPVNLQQVSTLTQCISNCLYDRN